MRTARFVASNLLVVLALAAVGHSRLDISRRYDPQELQSDIIFDPDQIRSSGNNVPNFFSLGRRFGFSPNNFLTGSMIQVPYSTISQMKAVRPVERVTGRIVGRPFTMREAVNFAGQRLINRIFPGARPMGGPSLPPPSPTPLAVPPFPPAVGGARRHSSLLLGKLTGSFNSKNALTAEMGNDFLETHDVEETRGKVVARDGDILRSSYVSNPDEVLQRLGYLPMIVNGRVVAGDDRGLDTVSPQSLAQPRRSKRESLLVGKLAASARTKRQAEQEMADLGVRDADEASGSVVANDKDIVRSSLVSQPAQTLRRLGRQAVEAIEVEKGRVVAEQKAPGEPPSRLPTVDDPLKGL